MNRLPIRRALLSVTDKTGLLEFAQFLANHGVELISTGGTHAALVKAGLQVTAVNEVTGFPEIMNGRVKTLHPNIHGGILADKDNVEHTETLVKHGIKHLDLVCVNLYDFAGAAAKQTAVAQIIEDIDIGGPCMLRAAAKNFHSVLVMPSTDVYAMVQADLQQNVQNGVLYASLPLRQIMAAQTFAKTSAYDAMIAEYLK